MTMTSDPVDIDEHERRRLASLNSFEILDTPPDGAFDSITELVATLLNVPIAIISLVDNDRIWFKSGHGVEATEIDREPGLCASAILQDSCYEVTNAALDPRTLANPLVAGEMGVRFYAAHPLTTEEGFNLGTLCVLDFEPRDVNDLDRQILTTLSKVVMDQMNLRLSARRINQLNSELADAQERLRHEVQHDSLTQLWNRSALSAFVERSMAAASRSMAPLSLVMIDIDRFKQVNDTYGHHAGDEVLVEVARRLFTVARTADAVGRLGGEEFLAVLENTTTSDGARAAERLRAAIADTPITITTDDGPLELPITASFGVAGTDGHREITEHMLRKRADDALYEAKHQGRNRVVSASPTTSVRLDLSDGQAPTGT